MSLFLAFLLWAFRHHFAGDFYRPLAQRRQAFRIGPNVAGLAVRVFMASQDASIIGRSNHKAATAVAFVLQELERVGALIAYINQLTTAWQSFRAMHPQSAFPRLAITSLGIRFTFGNTHPVMQYLVGQANHFTRFRIHRQAVLANITPMFPVADLPKTRKRSVSGVIQFGSVMKNQNRATHCLNDLQRAFPMRRHNRLVGDVGTVAKAVKSLQICGRMELVRQCAAGMSAQRVGALNQAFGTASISQQCVPKVHFTKALVRIRIKNHGVPSLRNKTGATSVTRYSSRTINLMRKYMSLHNRYIFRERTTHAAIAA
jgi:hypothetical protein